ncbi:MAG: BON domain-containing protein [Planctomycetaceae bacterium]|nr:BON domain-containing protein [Planctomycetaceae bacterium]MCA9021031.1 BON domain-containing protein [Planctomycetaceae bacterium]
MSTHITIDSAHQLSELIKKAISSSELFANQSVQYHVEQEQVVLTGIVGSYYAKQLAQESVSRIQGVRQVHNRLTVAQDQMSQPILSTN